MMDMAIQIMTVFWGFLFLLYLVASALAFVSVVLNERLTLTQILLAVPGWIILTLSLAAVIAKNYQKFGG